ncbi:MAG: adenylate kinase family protein [Mycobacteriales bacterium]
MEMRKYVVSGPQGSGKGTQALMLQRDLDILHISVGDIFRWNIAHHTKLGAKIRRIVAAGELVSDEMVDGWYGPGSTSTTGTTASSSTASRAASARPSSSWRATTSTP